MTTGQSALGAHGDKQPVPRPQTLPIAVARSIAGATDFGDLVRQVALCLELDEHPRNALRLWLLSGEEPAPLVRHPPGVELPHVETSVISESAAHGLLCIKGATFVRLAGNAGPLAVLEIRASRRVDAKLAVKVAAVAGARLEGLVSAQRQRELLPHVPLADDAKEIQEVISAFAAQAKQLLDHDRLSIYLLTPDGTALERFGVATSPIVPGEGDVLPLEQVGLTRVVKMNEPIVSADFGVDDRIRGLEDSLIARAGFHGLVSVPLRVGGQPFGLLNFVSKTAGFYNEGDVAVAQQIADEVSVFLQNLRLQYAVRNAVEREAIARERNRVARDFHDTLAQTLSSLAARAKTLNEDPALPKTGEVQEHAATLLHLAGNALEEVRRALEDMLPSELEGSSLGEAIECELSKLQSEAGISTSFALTGELSELPRATTTAVFRIFSEAIHNVRRHSEASSVAIQIRVDDELRMSVKDNGKGIHAEAFRDVPQGFGLETMRERAKALGGRLVVRSAMTSGTEVFLHLPHALDSDPPQIASTITLPGPVASVIRLIVIDDHPSFREGVRQLLESDGTIRVVAEAGTGRDGVHEIRSKRPDIVLLDLNLPDCSGIDLAKEISQLVPSTVVVMMSAFTEDATVAAALRAGARGYVAKSTGSAGLLHAIRTAVQGGTVVMPAVSDSSTEGEMLTERELEILRHVAHGMTNAEIGRELHLADKTVERVVSTITRKLHAKNRAHAIAKGVANRLIDVRDA